MPAAQRPAAESGAAAAPTEEDGVGYHRAIRSPAFVLFFMGSGPVKGFAVTLTIGIATSVFTAIFLTRLMIVLWLEWRKPKQLVL